MNTAIAKERLQFGRVAMNDRGKKQFGSKTGRNGTQKREEETL